MEKFIEIDHTGDIAFKALGEDIQSLFENAAHALYSHIIDSKNIAEKEHITLQVQGSDQSELLINWLNELHFLTETQMLIFADFDIEELTHDKLTANVHGEKYNKSRHGPIRCIKAVTYHNSVINNDSGGGYSCTIVCDV